jgi:hypothetical protein
MPASIQSKLELQKALSQRDVAFTVAIEVVNDADVRVLIDKVKGLIRQQKKLHVVILERP